MASFSEATSYMITNVPYKYDYIRTDMRRRSELLSETKKWTPRDFNQFLNLSTDRELIQMLQLLHDLPSQYSKSDPSAVIKAVRKGNLPLSAITPSAVRKALVYRANNKLFYPFIKDDEVDYHGIVQWVAGEFGVSDYKVSSLPTFALEREVTDKFFERMWDKLTPQQRKELIDGIEKEYDRSIPNKSTLLSMGGSAALGAIQAAILTWGLPTLGATLLSTIGGLMFSNAVLAFLAKWVGYGTGYVAGWIASIFGVGAFITGPIALIFEAGLVSMSLFSLGSAEKNTVAAFVMTLHGMKTVAMATVIGSYEIIQSFERLKRSTSPTEVEAGQEEITKDFIQLIKNVKNYMGCNPFSFDDQYIPDMSFGFESILTHERYRFAISVWMEMDTMREEALRIKEGTTKKLNP